MHFYKDIYKIEDINIAPGIYKLERLSTLNPMWISVSKVVVIHSIDKSGKNVFNESNLIRLSFVEEKVSSKKGKKFKLETKGRILIRGSSNLIFIGTAYHGGLARKGNIEKDIHTMIVREGGEGSEQLDQGYPESLVGICLESIHDSSHDPFASRVKLTYLGPNETENEFEFVQREMDPERDSYFFNTIDPQRGVLTSD